MKNESPHRGLKAAGAEAEIEQSQFTASPRSLQLIARALGGEVNGGEVRCPGPGHSAIDRSLSIKLDSNAPDGFLVHSFSPADDPIVCRDYVREKVGLPAFKWRLRWAAAQRIRRRRRDTPAPMACRLMLIRSRQLLRSAKVRGSMELGQLILATPMECLLRKKCLSMPAWRGMVTFNRSSDCAGKPDHAMARQ
jgi:hypothetical protein